MELVAKSWDAVYGTEGQPDVAKIAVFRQNLDPDGDAWDWWTNDLADEDKLTFASIKKAFLEKYSGDKNRAVSRFNIQNELMCLQQGKGSIVEYVWKAEALAKRVPADMNESLAMAFIRGLDDLESRRRISYDLRDTPVFTFSKVVHMVKSWYQDVGKPNPFDKFRIGQRETLAAPVAPIYAPPAVKESTGGQTAFQGTIIASGGMGSSQAVSSF